MEGRTGVRWMRRAVCCALAGALMAAVAPASAPAAPLPNDAFASAIAIAQESAVVTGTNVDATVEPGEPLHTIDEAAQQSVWWSWTAPASTDVQIDACGSDFQAAVAVYTGQAVDGLTPMSDDPPSGVCRVIVAVEAGVTYRIAVDGNLGDSGNIELSVDRGPPNDDFAAAEELVGSNA